MALILKKPLVFVGMMGAGKTAVGKAVSQVLNVPFLDSDSELEKAANLTIPEIFDRHGEAFFRKKETQVITRLLGSQLCVLSTGGGAFISEQNRAVISAQAVSVWLNVDLDVLWNRVRHKGNRPLLKTSDPFATLKSYYDKRQSFYALADIELRSNAFNSIDEMALKVIAALRKKPELIEEKNDA